MAFLLSPKTSGTKTYILTQFGVTNMKVNGATVALLGAECAAGDTITWDSPATITCTYTNSNGFPVDTADVTSPYTVEDIPEAVKIDFNGQQS
jgi:hypothetical protein